MTSLRDFIGLTTAPTTHVVDAWRVALFCRATGECEGIEGDVDLLRNAPPSSRPVPSTFLKALETDHCASATLLERMGVDLGAVLHAAQEFNALHPVFVGDCIAINREIKDCYDKRDGALTFILIQTQYLRDDKSVGTSLQTAVIRNKFTAAKEAS